MKGVLVFDDMLFRCVKSLHLNFYGKDKTFKKSPPNRYMDGRSSWNVGICHSFDSVNEFNNQKDPCIGCECTGYPCKEIA
jgi:hypothetical protein